jgi:hypothetical protein
MDSRAFTLFHVVISLAAIGIGFIAVYGLLTANLWGSINMLFLATTVLALYAFRLRGQWRVVFVISATPSLHLLAPNASEPPFAIAQGVVLLVFVAVGVLATRRFLPLAVKSMACTVGGAIDCGIKTSSLEY